MPSQAEREDFWGAAKKRDAHNVKTKLPLPRQSHVNPAGDGKNARKGSPLGTGVNRKVAKPREQRDSSVGSRNEKKSWGF